MLLEITQIKEWLAAKFNLRTEGTGGMLRIIDPVPPGLYEIPIGADPQPYHVQISDEGIRILGPSQPAPSKIKEVTESIFDEAVKNDDFNPESLGRLISSVIREWGKERPKSEYNPMWFVPYDDLPESHKELHGRVGLAIVSKTIDFMSQVIDKSASAMQSNKDQS